MSYIKESNCITCGTPIHAGSKGTLYCRKCFGLTRSKCITDFTFNEWSDKSAYILGYFFSDGYLMDTDGRKRLGICAKDKQLFDTIYSALELTHKPYVTKSGAYKTQFGHARLFDELVLLGCTPRKSLTIRLPKIPKEFLGSFIRGYFDGDGSFVVTTENRKTVKDYQRSSITFTSGSLLFLEDLSFSINEVFTIKGKVCRGHGAWTLIYPNVGHIKPFYDIMYKNSTPGLYSLAKRTKMDNYFKYISERLLHVSRDLDQVISA